MSFQFKGRNITLENYREVFKVCPPDILDEIRSAVLDDTQIASFIEPCGTDSYKLGQLRMSVREFLPVEYISTHITGRTMYIIRQGYSKNRDMSELLDYYDSKSVKLKPEIIEDLAEFVYLGVSIEDVDFTKVPEKLIGLVLKGLKQGYPMWLITDNLDGVDESYLKLLMRGMALGVDVHPFIDSKWDTDALILFFSYADKVDLNNFLSYINNKFGVESLNTLLKLGSQGVSIRQLCIKDNDGYPIYNSYQIYELGEALKLGVATPEMFDAKLYDIDIHNMVEKELKKKNRLLHVSLKHDK